MTEPSNKRPPKPGPDTAGVPVRVAAAGALDPAALAQAMRQLMEPLATLAIARGVPFATLEHMLKSAFVESARAAHPSLPSHRLVSRISTATGINRREVARLTETRSDAPAVHRSPATRVFTKWLGDPSLKTRKGTVKALPRQGPAPSFEALAQSVTRDVHPRSLLDELCRLGLARLDGDTVHLEHDSFVPRGDTGRMLGFLGSNVGDHLQAAVANVLSESPPHLEQAVFADGLSPASLEAFRHLMRAQWKALLDAAVPALQQLIDADRAAGRPQDQRVRVGLYTYSDAMPEPHEDAARKASVRHRKTASKPTET
jgi:Family of unknown function (DUF6502)